MADRRAVTSGRLLDIQRWPSKHALPSSAPRQFGSAASATRVTRSAPVSSSSASTRKPPKDFLSILDFEPDQIDDALRLAARMKQERRLGRRASTANALAALHVALIFEKPSLRTRATFEIAVRELGGDVIVPPTGRRRRHARDAGRRGAESGAVGGGGGHPHVRAGAPAGVRGGRAEAARHQRAERRGASVPGHGRSPHADRAVGRRPRPHARLHRRRQQRRDVARPRRDAERPQHAHRLSRRLRSARAGRRRGAARVARMARR